MPAVSAFGGSSGIRGVAVKPIIGAVGVLLAGLGGAFAADMPAPGPVPVPPAYYPTYYNWSGVYVGVNAGVGFGTSTWNCGPPGPSIVPVGTECPTNRSTGGFNISGALAGATLGANYQTGPFVVGFEGDIDWSGVRGSSSSAACTALTAGANFPLPAGSTCQTNITWLGTARARIGYAFDRVLVFGTAGAAFDGRQAVIVATTNLPPQLGWTVGAGVEYAFTDAISAKAEYLFANLGTNQCPVSVGCGTLGSSSLSVSSFNIVRAGVNYRFSW
jgi:outer membrane immunogenic protein